MANIVYAHIYMALKGALGRNPTPDEWRDAVVSVDTEYPGWSELPAPDERREE